MIRMDIPMIKILGTYIRPDTSPLGYSKKL